MAFAVNQVVDNYEFLGIIDKPKTGITYKVRNVETGELEALRALPGTTSSHPNPWSASCVRFAFTPA